MGMRRGALKAAAVLWAALAAWSGYGVRQPERCGVSGNRKLHIRDRRKLRSDAGLVICTDPPWWRSYMDGALQCTSGARGCC